MPSTSSDVQPAATLPSLMDEDTATAQSPPSMDVKTAPVMMMPQTIYIVPQFVSSAFEDLGLTWFFLSKTKV